MPHAPKDPAAPPEKYRDHINAAAVAYGVSPRLLAAVLWIESRFRDDIASGAVKSPAGALGLAQFMPATAAALGVDPLDPQQAIHGCARYLAQLYFLLGSWRAAVAAYNCGPTRLARDGLDAIPAETKSYLTLVQEAL